MERTEPCAKQLPTLAFHFPSQLVVGAVLGFSSSPGNVNFLCPTHALGWRGQGAALPQLSRMLCAFSRDIPGLQGRRKLLLKFMTNRLHLSRAMHWHGFSSSLPKFLFGLSEHLLLPKSVEFAKLERTTNTHKHINTCLCVFLTTKH